MASNLTGQVRNIAEVATAVARGDLSRKITVDVKGEILELKDTINTMVDNRILGLLWFIYCAGSFYHTTSGLMTSIQHAGFQITAMFLLGVLFNFIYLRGLIASIQMFDGNRNARRFILLLAALDALGGVGVLLTRSFQPLSFAFTILGVLTLWLLWPRHSFHPSRAAGAPAGGPGSQTSKRASG